MTNTSADSNVPIPINIDWSAHINEIRLDIYNQLGSLPVIVKVHMPIGEEEYSTSICYIYTPTKLLEFLAGMPIFGKISAMVYPESLPEFTIVFINEEDEIVSA